MFNTKPRAAISSILLGLVVAMTYLLTFAPAATATNLTSYSNPKSAVATGASNSDTLERRGSGLYDRECRGAPKAKIVRFFEVGDTGVFHPLRCGRYIHIRDRHGYTETTDKNIEATLKRPTNIEAQSPTATVYERFGIVYNRAPTFRVVVERKPYAGGRFGIVTAYYVTD